MVKVIDRVGTQAIYRMNHLIPPFNNPKARQALLYATGDQKDYLASMVGFPDYERPCWAVFVCGTPFETRPGSATGRRATRRPTSKRPSSC